MQIKLVVVVDWCVLSSYTYQYIESVKLWLIMISLYMHTTLAVQCKIRAWKKFKPERDSNQRPLRYHCSALRPIELSSQLGAGHVTSSQLARRLSRNYLRRNGGNVIVDNTGILRTNIPWSPLFRFWAFIYSLACNCILHLLRVYYELSTWPAPSCLDSSR